MNFQATKYSSDVYPLPSLIFSSHQEFGVDIQSNGEATMFTNWDGSHYHLIWDMPSTRCCQLSFQMAVKHPQPTTDTASGSIGKSCEQPESQRSHVSVQSFSSTRGVLFLLTGPFRIGMKLIYCYTGLKYLLFYYFCSWHESVLLEKIRMGSRQGIRKDYIAHQSEYLARLLVFLPKEQAVRHRAWAKSLISCVLHAAGRIEGLLFPCNGTEMDFSPFLCTSSDWQWADLALPNWGSITYSLILWLFVLLF